MPYSLSLRYRSFVERLAPRRPAQLRHRAGLGMRKCFHRWKPVGVYVVRTGDFSFSPKFACRLNQLLRYKCMEGLRVLWKLDLSPWQLLSPSLLAKMLWYQKAED
jgi:hypothetical protein